MRYAKKQMGMKTGMSLWHLMAPNAGLLPYKKHRVYLNTNTPNYQLPPQKHEVKVYMYETQHATCYLQAVTTWRMFDSIDSIQVQLFFPTFAMALTEDEWTAVRIFAIKACTLQALLP